MGFSKDLKEIIMMRMALKEKKRQEDEAERRWAVFISVLFFAAIMVCFFIMLLFENLGIIRWEGEALEQFQGLFFLMSRFVKDCHGVNFWPFFLAEVVSIFVNAWKNGDFMAKNPLRGQKFLQKWPQHFTWLR